jgi:DnaJ family protein A protein 2
MDLYGVLGIERSASSADIKKAYMKMAKTEHPDKGGDEEKFKKIVKAYEVLSDDEKREFYNQTGQIPGEGGVPEDVGSGGMGMPFPFGGMGMGMGGFTMNMNDLFGMFGGGGPAKRQQTRGKEPPKVVKIPVSLGQFYNGHVFGVAFERQRFCKGCKGTGAERSEDCGTCHGSGVQTKMMQMGPGMMMQSQGPCTGCSGKGKKQTGTCKECKGAAKFAEEKKLEVRIQPGMAAGETIIFPDVCSDSHEYSEPGDVHIVLEDADDVHGWQRVGADLVRDIEISYTDSLLGTTILLQGHPRTPEGMYVDIPGPVTNGEVLLVNEEGMPTKGRRGIMRLKLIVKISAEERAAIRMANAAMIADAAGISQFVKKTPTGEPHITTGRLQG